MKMITSALITLIAAAAFANEPTTTAPTDTTTAPPTATHDKMGKMAPGARMATAPTMEECTHKPETKGCDKVKKDMKKTK